MILSINTATDIYQFELYSPSFGTKKFVAAREDKKDALFYLHQFLSQNRLNFKKIKAIAVYTGKGSFTGLRTGATIANALAYSLNLPLFTFQSPTMSDKRKKAIYQKLLQKNYPQKRFVKINYKRSP